MRLRFSVIVFIIFGTAYRISEEDLMWLGEQIEELGRVLLETDRRTGTGSWGNGMIGLHTAGAIFALRRQWH